MHELQVWTAVEAEECDRRLSPVLQDHPDRVGICDPQARGVLHRRRQLFEGCLLEQEKHPDELFRPEPIGSAFHPTAEDVQALGQLPVSCSRRIWNLRGDGLAYPFPRRIPSHDPATQASLRP